jgi:hypothetical protein
VVVVPESHVWVWAWAFPTIAKAKTGRTNNICLAARKGDPLERMDATTLSFIIGLLSRVKGLFCL